MSNGVKPLWLIIKKANGYIKESDGNKYLTLIPSDERQDKPKKYEEIWSKINDLIRSTNNNSEEKYMKIKFNSNEDLPLKNKNKI